MNALPPRKIKPRSLPKVRKKPRRTSAIKCRAHLNWVKREFQCTLVGLTDKDAGKPHECWGPIDPDHIRTRGAGGGDEQVWPVCRGGHDLKGSTTPAEVNRRFGINVQEIGARLWEISPAGKSYRRAATKAPQVGTPDSVVLDDEAQQGASPTHNTGET